ncbi:MAG: hypothetical protein AB4352_06235 [Hormoscilla sp.]
MAKRRNPKKEKAQRNLAYARKFRKRKQTGRFSRRRYDRQPTAEEDDMEKDSSSSVAST